MMKNPMVTPKSRLVAISFFFVLEVVDRGALQIEYVPLNLQWANGITKVLGTTTFLLHR